LNAKSTILLTLLTEILSTVCTNVDPTLIADQRNFKAKYMQNGEEN